MGLWEYDIISGSVVPGILTESTAFIFKGQPCQEVPKEGTQWGNTGNV